MHWLSSRLHPKGLPYVSESLPPFDQHRRPLRDLRISVTDRCNLRCQYCMPDKAGLPHYEGVAREELLTFEEIVRVATAAVNLGARKLRVTGGEPLLRKDLPRLIAMLAAIPQLEDLALTTNGLLLPRLAKELKAAGLQRVTISLDTLDDAVFQRLTSRPNTVDEVLAGIDAAREAGLGPIKINTVVIRGVTDDAVLPLVERFRHSDCTLRFIEYMDVGNLNCWRREDVVSTAELLNRIASRFPVEPLAPTQPGEVASRYRFTDGGGELGFISSISQPFCGDCNRLRLSPDGTLFTCLFASQGFALRPILRSGADNDNLQEVMANLWRARTDRYSEQRYKPASTEQPAKVEMHHIGG